MNKFSNTIILNKIRFVDYCLYMEWFQNLIKNNTGISSKNFYLVCATLLSVLLLLVPIIALLIEVISTKTINSSLTGWAAYIGAVGTFATGAGLTKAWSEKNE